MIDILGVTFSGVGLLISAASVALVVYFKEVF
jgi:hypothetical protein